MLTKNKYLNIYRSIFSNFDVDFMNPSYAESVILNRGSGYFSLRSLILSMDGLIKFIKNGGVINLICNPDLSLEDIERIDSGVMLRKDNIIECLITRLENENDLDEKEILKMDIISNMIATNRLNIKVAYMPNGIYHEKFGTFIDEDKNMVYFNGSANETVFAKKRNFESIVVSTSWNGDSKYIENECEYFNLLWNNQVDGLEVMDFPKAVENKLFETYKRSYDLEEAIKKYVYYDSLPIKKTLYPYQEKAIEEFVNNGFKHFYEMATGTGKTFTSIRTIKRLNDITNKTFVIICVPQIDLQNQWCSALKNDGYSNVYLFGGMNDSKRTETDKNNAIIKYFTGEKLIICVAVYDTFFSKIYSAVSKIDNLFLIFDEAHNLTIGNLQKIPNNTKFKLGLSATVERFSDTETKAILNYFTEGTIEPYYYGIEEAIENGFLSHYEYHIIPVYLSEEEFEKYSIKTKSIATLINSDDKDDLERLNKLRNERSLIIKQTRSKVDKICDMIRTYNFSNSVIYCGQGKDEDESIIDRVTEILHKQGNYDVTQFTSKTINRAQVLYEFEHNYYDSLVAIKCFDEGVDVPKLDKIYIMASDSSMRQTVQRRGRVLRKCKETGKTIAYIYDMITLPPYGIYGGFGVNSLLLNELRRVKEYARLADNLDKVEVEINDLIDTYNVVEEEIEYEE